MKLWGGRFTKETDKLVHAFNASVSFDQKFYKEDIEGSIAHVTMLAKQKIITEDEELTKARLYLSYVTGIVLKVGARLLGIEMPNKM